MVEKKVPISLSRNDYAFLNYIQQGILYSGAPISKAFDFSDILKACVTHSVLKILGDWENEGIKTVKEFLSEVGITDINLPKTDEEFTLQLKLSLRKSIIDNYLSKIDSESVSEKRSQLIKEFGAESLGSETPREPGMSNFILKLKGDEINTFDELKLVIEKFKKSTVSYSEMTRVLFRNTFINVERDDISKQVERFGLLSSFYIGGIYGFNPVESTLLRYHFDGGKGLPKISKEGLERLGHVFSDEILFKIYIKEVKDELSKEFTVPSESRRIYKKEKKNTHILVASQNKLLDEKYRSSVIHSVGFHSIFLGYFLLFMEWFWDQHKLPLLTSFLTARNETEYSFIQPQLFNALLRFELEMENLFKFSKEYRNKQIA